MAQVRVLSSWLLAAIAVIQFALITQNDVLVSAMPAYPFPITDTQSNGQQVQVLMMGDERFSYYLNPAQPAYALVRDVASGTNDYVYAVAGPQMLSLQPTPFKLGVVDPAAMMLPAGVGPAVAMAVAGQSAMAESLAGNSIAAGANNNNNNPFVGSSPFQSLGRRRIVNDNHHGFLNKEDSDKRRAAVVGTRRNLVLLLRFADHATRQLPTPAEYSVVFNKVGGDPKLCRSGSVRDYWTKNSFNKLTVESVVTPWIQVTIKESDITSDNNAGRNSANQKLLADAVVQALNILKTKNAANLNGDPSGPIRTWKDFDVDGDGKVDVFTVVHSGYAAERTGTDAAGKPPERRIWSRRFVLSMTDGSKGWTSPTLPGKTTGLSFYDLSMNNGLWGLTGKEIGRIGVITHEMGHFFNVWDLYADGTAGGGMGKWSLMAKSWGWDGSQERPPGLDGYCKYALGFVTPTDITASYGVKTLRTAQDYADLHKIRLNQDGTEYLLIENRQATGWDVNMTMMPGTTDKKNGGLLILHIDEKAGSRAENVGKSNGYPGATNWPQNNVHYPVAILAADGQFHSEKPAPPSTANPYDLDEGHADDLWRKTNGVLGLSAYTVPNTNAYQGGVEVQTYVTIDQISETGASMTYRYTKGTPVTKCAGTADPCNAAQKGGVCFMASPTATTPTCRCNSGWSGANCKTKDVCMVQGGNRCGPNGQCIADSTKPGGYRCACSTSSFGPKCVASDCSTGTTKCTQFRGYLSGTETVALPFGVIAGASTFLHSPQSASGFKMDMESWSAATNAWVTKGTGAGPGLGWTLSTNAAAKMRVVVKASGSSGFFDVKISVTVAASPCSAGLCPTASSTGTCSQKGAVGVCTCKTGYSGLLCETTGTQ